MKRLLALDIGDVRIGIAVCLNPLGIVSPHSVYVRTKSIRADVKNIADIIAANRIETVVVGLPESEDPGQAQKNTAFAERLARRSGMPPFRYWNEAYTTAEAESELIGMGRSRQKRSRVIDRSAAALILESYIRSGE